MMIKSFIKCLSTWATDTCISLSLQDVVMGACCLLVRGTTGRPTVDSPGKRPLMAGIFFFVAGLSKLLNKQASYWWYEMPCPRDHCNTIWLSVKEMDLVEIIINARICLIYLHGGFHISGLIILSTFWSELKREILSFHNVYNKYELSVF